MLRDHCNKWCSMDNKEEDLSLRSQSRNYTVYYLRPISNHKETMELYQIGRWNETAFPLQNNRTKVIFKLANNIPWNKTILFHIIHHIPVSVSLPNCVGIFPVSEFEFSARYKSLLRSPSCGGIVPVNKLFPRSKDVSLLTMVNCQKRVSKKTLMFS